MPLSSRALFDRYDSYKVGSFNKRHFTPDALFEVLNRLTTNSSGVISMEQRGKSFEGRPIHLIRARAGATKVLFWTQMHGDESTATMAICDVLKFLISTHKEDATRELLEKISLYIVPMLNPDGAARTQRRTAQMIDMNRDAVALRTPEARLLKQLQADLKPDFGFNLHDQELSTVAMNKELSALALLAPAYDVEKNTNDVRLRARHLAAFIAEAVAEFIPGKLTRYDDTFEPRAFGDNMQKWGTSTVLIESGHALDDQEKDSIRKLNAVALLTSLFAIAGESYRNASLERYETLPFNGKRAYDVVIRNVVMVQEGKETIADLGISYQVDTHSEETPRLVDLGDLSTFLAVREIDGKRKKIRAEELRFGEFQWEKIFT